MPVGEKQTYRFGPFELDTQCGQLRRDGVGLKLQGQPVYILEILLERPGQLVTREELRERLWTSDTFVDFDHSLNSAIKKLRRELGDEAETPRYIETLPRRGYRFIGEVIGESSPHKISEAGSLAGKEFAPKVATTLADATINVTDSRRRVRRRKVWLGTLSALLVVTAGAAYWLSKPLPLPRIVATHALTKTGFRKSPKLLTDGVNIYFRGGSPHGLAILQVHKSGGEPSEVLVPKSHFALLDISPDGSSLLTLRPNLEGGQDTWIQPLPSGPARLVLKDSRWPLWTPDGKSILFARNLDHDLYRANADGSDVRRLATLPDIGVPAISPDGRRIRFTVHPKYDLWEARSDGSGAHAILPEYSEGPPGLGGSWSADGKYFFFSYGAERDDLWVLPESRHWWQKAVTNPVRLTFSPVSIEAPTVSKDGRQLFAVTVERHGELSVYDRKFGQFVPYLNGIPACYVDFSRDGKWMAYVSYPEGTLWRSRTDGSERMQLTSPLMGVTNPRWSPDGKLIVFMDLFNGDKGKVATENRIYMISADGGGPILLLAGPFNDPTWSPDGRSIAYSYSYADPPAEVRILDLQTLTSTTVPGSSGFWSPRWSPDGKHLVAIGASTLKLGLFSFATQKWETLSGGNYGWPAWSHDSKFVYVVDWLGKIVRFNIADRKMEEITSLKGFSSTAYFFWRVGWYGLTPDDRPISTRDTGIEEIYAFDVEYK